MQGQLDLNSEETLVKRTINHQSKQSVTFKGGQDRLAHRWFRLTPSYSPDLVSSLLDRFGSEDTRVFDPFLGRGTTAIECRLRKIPCVGIEINPALWFASNTSLRWDAKPTQIRKQISDIVAECQVEQIQFASLTLKDLSTKIGIPIPPIYNVMRWWREDVLKSLILIHRAINRLQAESPYQELLLLALMSILTDTANITLGRLQLHFIDRSNDKIDALGSFLTAAMVIADDLERLADRGPCAESRVYQGDNRNAPNLLGDYKANLVITSPPYPNRYSYVWNTRPHLYFMQWMSSASQASALDCQTIGGTWGTATSRHLKGSHAYSDCAVEAVVGRVVDEIRTKDLLMSNYVARYFDDLYQSIQATKLCLEPGSICAYVVGNSRAKGTIVETQDLLASLFQKLGFTATGNEEIRRRNSGRELHETIVFARLNAA